MTDSRERIDPAGNDPQEEVELSDTERRALAGLPRELDPGRLLEERTVLALRERGQLVPPVPVVPDRSEAVSASTAGRPWWRSAVAIAAGIALFAGGLSVGQILGARQTADALQTVFEEGDVRLASQVQRAGSDYVASLVALTEAEATVSDSGQALEVALTALWAAASEIVRLAPDDPLAARILQGFEARARRTRQYGTDSQLLVEF